jgi:exosortase/archaeosortase family protein
MLLASDAASAQGLGPPGGGGGTGGVGGLAAALPFTEDALPGLLVVLVAMAAAALWRTRGRLHLRQQMNTGIGWLLAGVIAIGLAALPAWAALSLLLVIFAAARARTPTTAQCVAPVVVAGAIGVAHIVDITLLARGIAQLVGVAMTAVGVSVEVVDATVFGPGGYVHVAAACVGLQGTVVALSLSTALAMMLGAGPRLALLAGVTHAAAWGVLNVVRIAHLGVIAQTDLALAERTHDIGGLWMAVAHLVACGVTCLVFRRHTLESSDVKNVHWPWHRSTSLTWGAP